jgi:hypothetical protein
MKIQSLKDHCNPLMMQKHMSAAVENRISFTVGGKKYYVFAFMANPVRRHQRYFTDLSAMHFICNYLHFLLCLRLLTHQHINSKSKFDHL